MVKAILSKAGFKSSVLTATLVGETISKRYRAQAMYGGLLIGLVGANPNPNPNPHPNPKPTPTPTPNPNPNQVGGVVGSCVMCYLRRKKRKLMQMRAGAPRPDRSPNPDPNPAP